MSEQDEILKLYCRLMKEATIRFDIINHTYHNDAKRPPMMVREICYLQFRFVCEIIALGCLVACREIPGTQAIRDTYEPGRIIQKLEWLNPYFYPQPIEIKKSEADKTFQLIARPDQNHLGKQELRTLWGRAGDALHRSPMVKMINGPQFDPEDFSDILDWSAKLTGLLNCHWITLVENKRGMYVSLAAAETREPAATILDFDKLGGSVTVATLWVK